MHPASQAIKTLIENIPDYNLDILIVDLNEKTQQEEFLTPKEICTIFKFSLWTFHDWKKKGVFIPYSVGSGFPRYKKSEVLAVLKRQ